MALELSWDRTLRYRRGGSTRLDSLDIYYEFDWRQTLGHNTSQFTHGQCLAQFVRECCPAGKTPVLLLTDRDDVPEGARETDSQFVFVLNLPRYIRAHADAALSYLASRVGPGMTRFNELVELAQANPEVVRSLISSNLEFEDIVTWAGDDTERVAQLRSIPGVVDHGTETRVPDLSTALKALAGFLDLDPDAAESVARLFGPGEDRARRLQLVRAITKDPTGLYITGEVLAERTSERIADARRSMADYQALLDDPTSDETDMQEFIEKNLWLLGLHYAKMVPQQALLGGWLDFALERLDGFQDVLELKSPQDPLIRVSGSYSGDGAPRPSAYSLSHDLAQSLAQVHAYRDRLTRHADATRDLLGLKLSRDPWLIILIGRAAPLPEHSRRVLTELNRSLHRVEVVPYDLLAKRAGALLDNIDHYLLATGRDVEAA